MSYGKYIIIWHRSRLFRWPSLFIIWRRRQQLRKGKNCDRRKQISSSFAFCLLPFAFCLSYMGNNVELSLFLLCCCVSTRTNLQQKPMHSVIVQPIQLQTIRTSLCELFNIHSYHCMLFLFFHRSHIKQAQVRYSPLTGLWRHFPCCYFHAHQNFQMFYSHIWLKCQCIIKNAILFDTRFACYIWLIFFFSQSHIWTNLWPNVLFSRLDIRQWSVYPGARASYPSSDGGTFYTQRLVSLCRSSGVNTRQELQMNRSTKEK